MMVPQEQWVQKLLDSIDPLDFFADQLFKKAIAMMSPEMIVSIKDYQKHYILPDNERTVLNQKMLVQVYIIFKHIEDPTSVYNFMPKKP